MIKKKKSCRLCGFKLLSTRTFASLRGGSPPAAEFFLTRTSVVVVFCAKKNKKIPFWILFSAKAIVSKAELHKVVECGLVLQYELVQLVKHSSAFISKTRIIYCRTNAITSALDAGCRFSSPVSLFFCLDCAAAYVKRPCVRFVIFNEPGHVSS